jgi:hypothetical protein
MFQPETNNNANVKHKSFSQAADRPEALNELRTNHAMLPILPKKKSNPIRMKQLEALREK